MNRINMIGVAQHRLQIHQAIAACNKPDTGASGIKLILEPVARNTAAAIAVACATALREHDDALLLLCPADHAISTAGQFWHSVRQGVAAAMQGAVVTFGLLPERPETGYGYIEADNMQGEVFPIRRFVEKPDYDTAVNFIRQGCFFWNSGIFLARARIICRAFLEYAPDIWQAVQAALNGAGRGGEADILLPQKAYEAIPAISFDHAIMEKLNNCAMVPASFYWSDLGSWQSLLHFQQTRHEEDSRGNIISGDVIAEGCHNSYLRSESGLLTVSGLADMAVIATGDATFVAPLAQAHHMQAVIGQLEAQARRELYYAPAPPLSDWHTQVRHWLFDKALPYWAANGVDYQNGGFYERLSLQGKPVAGLRRSRTMARQIYAFAKSHMAGWAGEEALPLITHGLAFMQARGRSQKAGWLQSFHADGAVAQEGHNFYDQTCMLLALAYAKAAGHNHALHLAQETFYFLDKEMAHPEGGFFETDADRNQAGAILSANAHMHYLEACLAWHEISGDTGFLHRAAEIAELCHHVFFDQDNWCIGEFFDRNWQRARAGQGDYTQPGHAFEWAALLSDYALRTGCMASRQIAFRCYSHAMAAGTNRTTGLVYNALSRAGRPLDRGSRSWQQCEAIKAAIMLNGYNDIDLRPEIESRIETLFRWHLQPAQQGLWIDQIDHAGIKCSGFVPASILYHLVSALTLFLEKTGAKNMPDHAAAKITRNDSGSFHAASYLPV
ncbi:AGE family epimerase/isomerase [Pseudochrobactrum sp. HB0163]|uniref:AGE family epimerase/isomerase n=1 Tax=Pseudochrobactrum sp. HB0163 TaxID=3450708 RepID=UPI003F6E2192